MAKSKTPYTPPPAKARERKLYYGEAVACLDLPNHLLSADVHTEESRHLSIATLSRKFMWPLLAAAVRATEAGEDHKPVFVDDHYGVKVWEDWVEHAPTWMDPHLFLRMAEEDERVQKILRVSFKKNDPDAWERLLPLFREIFDSRYLPYVIERFEQDALQVMAQWLVLNNAQKLLDEKRRSG